MSMTVRYAFVTLLLFLCLITVYKFGGWLLVGCFLAGFVLYVQVLGRRVVKR